MISDVLDLIGLTISSFAWDKQVLMVLTQEKRLFFFNTQPKSGSLTEIPDKSLQSPQKITQIGFAFDPERTTLALHTAAYEYVFVWEQWIEIEEFKGQPELMRHMTRLTWTPKEQINA